MTSSTKLPSTSKSESGHTSDSRWVRAANAQYKAEIVAQTQLFGEDWVKKRHGIDGSTLGRWKREAQLDDVQGKLVDMALQDCWTRRFELKQQDLLEKAYGAMIDSLDAQDVGSWKPKDLLQLAEVCNKITESMIQVRIVSVRLAEQAYSLGEAAGRHLGSGEAEGEEET